MQLFQQLDEGHQKEKGELSQELLEVKVSVPPLYHPLIITKLSCRLNLGRQVFMSPKKLVIIIHHFPLRKG